MSGLTLTPPPKAGTGIFCWQLVPSDEKVRLGLTPYFESAHLDAMLLKLAIATGAAAIPKRNVRRCSLFTVPSLALRGGPPSGREVRIEPDRRKCNH